MSDLSFQRRTFLTAATTSALIGSLGVATGTTNDEPSLSHIPSRSRRITDGLVSSLMIVRADNIDLDSSTNWGLRIEDGQNQSVRVVPHSTEPIEGSPGIDLFIYDGAGRIKEEPTIRVEDQIPVDVTGDVSMFETNPIFTGYTIQLVAEDETVASTDEHVYGIGHPTDAFSQDSTTGEIEVTYDRSHLIDESWTLRLALRDYDTEDGSVLQSLDSVFEYEDGTFVTTFDAAQVDPLPDDAFRDIDVDFYDQPVDTDRRSPEELQTLWGLTDITIDESDQTDPDPPETGTVEGVVTDNAGNPLAGTTVEFVDTDTGSVEETTTTDSDGSYSIELPLGEYQVTATNDGFDPATEAVTVEDVDVTYRVDITVSPTDEPSVIDYANDDGTVDIQRLRDAIDDWRGGDIDISLLRDVIDAWRSGNVVG